MLRRLLTAGLAAVTAGVLAAGAAAAEERGGTALEAAVVNGWLLDQDTGTRDWPWLAAIYLTAIGPQQGAFCTGTVVTPDTVLTAAHCVTDAPGPFSVMVGSTWLSDPAARRVGVRAVAVHSSYRPDRPGHDVAVVRLDRPAGVPPLPVAGAGDPLPGTLDVAGFGCVVQSPFLNACAFFPFFAYAAEVAPQPDDVCSSVSSLLGATHDPALEFCAGGFSLSGTAPDTCQGDSGGPVVGSVRGRRMLVGITSRGFDCGYVPGIYTRAGAVRAWIDAEVRRSGYWALGGDGEVFAFGDAPLLGRVTGRAVDLEPTPTGFGYWVLEEDGRITGFGDAAPLVLGPVRLGPGERFTSLSARTGGRGLWAFTNQGRAFATGDAVHQGDLTGITLNGPIEDSVATRTGAGYWMVAADGGVFAFGDARFRGSMGGRPLNAPVTGMVPDPDGEGYWMVAADGGVFAFSAPFRGSLPGVLPPGTRLNGPIVGIVPYGNGYLMVGNDGGVFNFSERPFAGSLANRPLNAPVVSIAPLDRGLPD